jgi:hypothetical protein
MFNTWDPQLHNKSVKIWAVHIKKYLFLGKIKKNCQTSIPQAVKFVKWLRMKITLKVLSYEMDLAEIRFFRYVVIQEWGAEIFWKIRLFSMLECPPPVKEVPRPGHICLCCPSKGWRWPWSSLPIVCLRLMSSEVQTWPRHVYLGMLYWRMERTLVTFFLANECIYATGNSVRRNIRQIS